MTRILQFETCQSRQDLLNQLKRAFGLDLSAKITLRNNHGRVLASSDKTSIKYSCDDKETDQVMFGYHGSCLQLELNASGLLGGASALKYSSSHLDDSQGYNDSNSNERATVDLKTLSNQLNADIAPQQIATGREVLLDGDEHESIFINDFDSLRDRFRGTVDFEQLREYICKASPSVRKSIMGLLSEKEKTQFEEWLIKETFTAKIIDFKGAQEAQKESMQGAIALDLPLEHFYSEFVQVLGSDSLMFARIEKQRALVTDRDFQIFAEKPTEVNWSSKPIRAQIKDQHLKVKWHINLTFFLFSTQNLGVSVIQLYPVENVHIADDKAKQHQRILYSGQDGSVFWLSGDKKEHINFYKQGEKEHFEYPLNKQSALYEYWTKGNDISIEQQEIDGKNKTTEISLPTAQPFMMLFKDERVIIFNRFRFGERPSTCFYSLSKGREFLQCQGSTMLLHLSSSGDRNSSSSKQRCLFYTNPLIARKIIKDDEELIKLKDSLKVGSLDKPVVQSKDLDIHAAMDSDQKVIINLQSEDQASEQSVAYECKSLQTNLQGWMIGGPVTVLQSDHMSSSKQFAIWNNRQAAVCESKSPNELSCIYFDRMKPAGVYCIRYKSAQEDFEVFAIDVKNFKLMTSGPIRSNNRIKEYEIPRDIDRQLIKRDATLLATMIGEKFIKPYEFTEETKFRSCFSIVNKISLPKWDIQSLHPFQIIANVNNPGRIYLAWKDEDEQKLVSFDLSELGLLYSLVRELDRSDESQTCIPILIRGFDSQSRLTRLQIEFPKFCWHDMAIKEGMHRVTLKQYENEVRFDVVSRYSIRQIFTRDNTIVYCVTDTDLVLLDEARQALFQCNNGQSFSCCTTLGNGSLLYAIEDSASKSSIIKSDDLRDWNYRMQTERIVQMQQCPLNEQRESAKSKIRTELLVLDNHAHFSKLRYTDQNEDTIFEVIMNLDLSIFPSISLLVEKLTPDDSMILTSRSITHKDKVYCVESGQKFKLLEAVKEKGEKANSSIRVPYSDEIIIAVKSLKTLKICIVHEASSRSQNPYGTGAFGLKTIQRVLDVGHNNFLVQCLRMKKFDKTGKCTNSISYWSLLSDKKIKKISAPLLEFLLKQEHQTKIRSCQIINGNCKLSMYQVETDQQTGLLKTETRKAKILEISHKAEKISLKEIIPQDLKIPLIQEQIMMNYAGDEILVQVTNDQDKMQESVLLYDQEPDLKRLIIKSKERLHLALVGLKTFWSNYQSTEILYYDLKTRKLHRLNLEKYTVKEIQNEKIYLKDCLPHQIIKTSHKSKLDRDTMINHSEHLQVTADDMAYIFDCNGDNVFLIDSIEDVSMFNNPELYVESSICIYNTKAHNGIKTYIQVNPQANTIITRMIISNNEEEFIEKFSKVVGIYGTYSILDLHIIENMRKTRTVGKYLDSSVVFAMFGTQNAIEVVAEDLHLLNDFRKAIVRLDLNPQGSKDRYSANQVRLANILMFHSHINYDKGVAQLSSLLRDNIEQTIIRDIILKIGRHSPAFSIFKVFKNQTGCQRLFTYSTVQSYAELQKCFRQTVYTNNISMLPWPQGLKFITIMSCEIIITEEQIKKILDQKNKQLSGNLMINRAIKVSMVEVGWFFNNRKNFIAFSKLLQNLPNKVYTSQLLKGLLDKYWEETQKKILIEQLIPYSAYVILCIVHFSNVLSEQGDLENKLLLNIGLCLIIFPLWLHQVYNEYRQIKTAGFINVLKSFWNWTDAANLTLNAFVLVQSFEAFRVIEIDENRVIASISSCLMIFKFFDLLRVFEETAYYILLIQETISGIQFYMILIILAFTMFGVPMTILNFNRYSHNEIVWSPTTYWFIDMLINQYILALGDFVSLLYYEKGNQTIFCLIFFILATFITQITMFNMLIAIMSDTFDKITENKEVNAIKSKLALMGDLADVMSQQDSEQSQERFFFIVQPTSKDNENDDEDQWTGSLNQMTRIMKKNRKKLEVRIEASTDRLENQLQFFQRNDQLIGKQFKTHVKQVVQANSLEIKKEVQGLEQKLEQVLKELALIRESKQKGV